MDRAVTKLHCINDTLIVSAIFPFQLFHTLFLLFCTGGQTCPMPFDAPESENQSILHIREVAFFGMLQIVLKKTLSWCWFKFCRTSVSGCVHFKENIEKVIK